MKKCFFTCVCLLLALPVQADLYGVSNVSVMAEAENAVLAKETALTEATIQAFPKLLARLVAEEDMPIVQTVISTTLPEQIAEMVEGVSVANEKNTPTRYMADVTVQFKRKPVQELLRSADVHFLEIEPEPLVIVPVFRENDMVRVFDESNPMMVALRSVVPENGLHRFIVPAGDERDTSSLTEEMLIGMDLSGGMIFANRYRAKGILVVDITKNEHVYTVKTMAYPSHASIGSEVMFAVSSTSENMPAVVAKIMQKAVDKMGQQFRQAQFDRTAMQSYITAEFTVANLTEWTAIERRLAGLKVIDTVNVRAIFKDKIYAVLSYSEPLPEVLGKMALGGFSLVQRGDVYVWQKSGSGY